MGEDPAIAQERRDECRRKVLGFLAERAAVAHHPKTIRRRLNDGHEHDFTDAEVAAALTFLLGLAPKRVRAVTEPMGSTLHYQATSDGVLAHERGT